MSEFAGPWADRAARTVLGPDLQCRGRSAREAGPRSVPARRRQHGDRAGRLRRRRGQPPRCRSGACRRDAGVRLRRWGDAGPPPRRSEHGRLRQDARTAGALEQVRQARSHADTARAARTPFPRILDQLLEPNVVAAWRTLTLTTISAKYGLTARLSGLSS